MSGGTGNHGASAVLNRHQDALADQIAILARSGGTKGRHEFAALLSLVAGESAFKPHAENHRTGAQGPFQFVKSTWLSLLRTHGAVLGIKPALIAQIVEGANGRPTIANHAVLRELLSLRNDFAISAQAAAFYLDDNRAALARSLHRAPTDAEVRLSFLLGPHGAAKLIRSAERTPETPAASIVPRAAAANPRLFYLPDGEPRDAAAILAFLDRSARRDAAKYAAYARVQDAAV